VTYVNVPQSTVRARRDEIFRVMRKW